MTEAVGPCVLWDRYINPHGYGRLTVGGRHGKYAHRHIWELEHGPIPEGMRVHHICRNRACVNVEHLSLVTHKENILLGVGPTAANARKTHCVHGHLLDERNTYLRPGGGRDCRRCVVARVTAYRKRKRLPA